MEEMNLHFTGDFHAITTRAQPAVGDDRQPHLLGQRAGHRRAPHRLAPRDGHERPRAARHRGDRWAACRTASRARPGSTSPWPRKSWRSCACPTTSRTCEKRLGDIVVAYTPREEAGLCPRHQGRRRDDGAAEGRDAAEPRADAGEQPGLRAWRPVRQHRAWLQLGHRDQDRAEAGRVCGDRSRLRRRPWRREVLRHQVPQGRAEARGCGDRGHGARDEDERRRGEGRPWRRERRGREEGLPEPWPPHRQREELRRAGGGGDQPLLQRHRCRDCRREGLCRRAGRRGDPVQALGAGLGRDRGTGAQGGAAGGSRARRTSRRSTPTRCRCSRRSRPSPSASTTPTR